MKIRSFRKWKDIEKLTPFIGSNEYKELTVGERVKYHNITCWSFMRKSTPLYGTINGMEDGLYILNLENGTELKVNRHKIEPFPLTYQSI